MPLVLLFFRQIVNHYSIMNNIHKTSLMKTDIYVLKTLKAFLCQMLKQHQT